MSFLRHKIDPVRRVGPDDGTRVFQEEHAILRKHGTVFAAYDMGTVNTRIRSSFSANRLWHSKLLGRIYHQQ